MELIDETNSAGKQKQMDEVLLDEGTEYSAAQEMSDRGSSEDARSMERLPNEVLEIIIDFSLTGSPRNIVDSFNDLCMVSKRFRSLTASFIKRAHAAVAACLQQQHATHGWRLCTLEQTQGYNYGMLYGEMERKNKEERECC